MPGLDNQDYWLSELMRTDANVYMLISTYFFICTSLIIQIKLNRLVLSTYDECRMHIDTSFHSQFRDLSQVVTYDHTSSVIITIMVRPFMHKFFTIHDNFAKILMDSLET